MVTAFQSGKLEGSLPAGSTIQEAFPMGEDSTAPAGAGAGAGASPGAGGDTDAGSGPGSAADVDGGGEDGALAAHTSPCWHEEGEDVHIHAVHFGGVVHVVLHGIPAARLQLHSQLGAYEYLQEQPLLTAEVIRTTNLLLLQGGIRATTSGDWVPSAGGQFRTKSQSVRAGSHLFLDVTPEHCVCLLTGCCYAFEASVTAEKPTDHPVVIASRLFHAVISLHPFVNGNGRLCRLLFSYALGRMGVTYPVVLGTGQKKSRKAYGRALQAADGGHFDQLYTFALQSTALASANMLQWHKLSA